MATHAGWPAWAPKGFEAAVRRELPRWGGQRAWRRIIGAVFTALTDAAGVAAQRRGALERARWVLEDWRTAQARLAQVQARMVEVLDELGLTDYLTSIPGLSAVGAAAILAETGDPTRFDSARALAKHAGLCPRSGTFASARPQEAGPLGVAPPSSDQSTPSSAPLAGSLSTSSSAPVEPTSVSAVSGLSFFITV